MFCLQMMKKNFNQMNEVIELASKNIYTTQVKNEHQGIWFRIVKRTNWSVVASLIEHWQHVMIINLDVMGKFKQFLLVNEKPRVFWFTRSATVASVAIWPSRLSAIPLLCATAEE